MKMKKEYIVLAIIIIALSVYLFMRRGDRTLYELPKMPEVAQKEITRLQITRGENVIELNKKDNSWHIAPKEFPADNNKVKNMLENIEKLTLTALVSESKNYNLYDLTGESKINVKAWQGDSLKRDIDVGKTASSYRHTFVKTAGDDRVFHARGNFRNAFDIGAADLRDKSVLSYTSSDIQQIQITKEQQSIVLKRTQLGEQEAAPKTDGKESAPPPAPKTVWQSPDGRTGDETAVNQILSRLSNLRCEKFIDDRGKENFTAPLLALQLKGTQEYNLAVFAKAGDEDTEYPAISSENNYAFLLSDSLVEDILEEASQILKEPETEKPASEKQEGASQEQKE
jgi:hypothetical protein